MNFDNIKRALTVALSRLGVTEYEIYYTFGGETSVGTLNREVNSFSSGESGTLFVRVLVGGKMGSASTELLDEGAMMELAERAVQGASAVEKVDAVGLYHGSDSYEELSLPQYTPMNAGELRRIATDLSDTIYSKSESVKDGTTTTAFTSSYHIRLINSHGLDLECQGGINALLGEAVVEVGGEGQSDYSYRAIEEGALDKVASESVENALAKIGAREIPSGKYDIVFSGKEMRSILSVYASAFSAKAALDGMSPLRDKEGEVIASPLITVTDDPQRAGNYIGINFDSEGVATHRKAIIEDGVLRTLLHNRETAKRMGKETTANAGRVGGAIDVRPFSFCIEPGKTPLDELFRRAEGGIYITEVKGLHAGANVVTGDFSLESEGFIIRDGKLGEAVKSFTVAGNFYEMLRAVSGVSDRLDRGVQTGFTGYGSPDILVPEMSVAGK